MDKNEQSSGSSTSNNLNNEDSSRTERQQQKDSGVAFDKNRNQEQLTKEACNDSVVESSTSVNTNVASNNNEHQQMNDTKRYNNNDTNSSTYRTSHAPPSTKVGAFAVNTNNTAPTKKEKNNYNTQLLVQAREPSLRTLWAVDEGPSKAEYSINTILDITTTTNNTSGATKVASPSTYSGPQSTQVGAFAVTSAPTPAATKKKRNFHSKQLLVESKEPSLRTLLAGDDDDDDDDDDASSNNNNNKSPTSNHMVFANEISSPSSDANCSMYAVMEDVNSASTLGAAAKGSDINSRTSPRGIVTSYSGLDSQPIVVQAPPQSFDSSIVVAPYDDAIISSHNDHISKSKINSLQKVLQGQEPSYNALFKTSYSSITNTEELEKQQPQQKQQQQVVCIAGNDGTLRATQFPATEYHPPSRGAVSTSSALEIRSNGQVGVPPSDPGTTAIADSSTDNVLLLQVDLSNSSDNDFQYAPVSAFLADAELPLAIATSIDLEDPSPSFSFYRKKMIRSCEEQTHLSQQKHQKLVVFCDGAFICRQRICFLLSILIMLVGATVALTRSLYKSHNHKKRYTDLLAILIEHAVSSPSDVNRKGSPQNNALTWLAYNDAANVPVTPWIIQRYILVVLHYSLNGKDWEGQYNFLSSDHECRWNGNWNDNYSALEGVTCDSFNKVIFIFLARNSLNGNLPVQEISCLTKLRQLNLENNGGISGTLGSELGKLSNLVDLVLGYNRISGTISSEIGKLNNLVTLDLRGNKLSGILPASMGYLSNMTTLKLSDNSFTGTIPASFANLSSLDDIWLYTNFLTGNVSFMCPLSNVNKISVECGEVSCTCVDKCDCF